MSRLRSSWWWGGLAFAGIVATHALTYRVMEHEHGARHAVLDRTFGLAAAVAVLVTFVVHTARSSTSGRLPVWRLALLQGGGWLLIEGLERVSSGHGALLDRAMVVGLLVQLVMAVVGVLLLALLAKVVRLLVASRRRWRRQPERRRPSMVRNGCWPRLSPAAPRGPPYR